MSSLITKGNASGTGSVTLESPNTNSDFTISLPAATGTAILANGSGDLQMNSGYGSVATAYGCRAWVNFNGTGTVAINASGNVSSITDHGTGNYTINFTTALADANYSSYGSCRPTAGGSPHYLFYVENRDNVSRTTSALRIYLLNPTNQLAADGEVVSVAIIR